MPATNHRCPICRETYRLRAEEPPPHFPFCSQRCRMIDLGRWLDGDYRVAGRPATLADVDVDENA